MSKTKVLFVGEGNFSYAAAEARKECHTVVATALLGDKPPTEQQRKNIQDIKDHGGLVFLDVDATSLSQHAEITSMQLDRVQFNFPHVGGKMNIKANRSLVKQFFESCKNLVDMGCIARSNGQVWVTLCAGQGGTPADTKLRKWQDTWQVVTLAESTQFGLVDVKPFCSSNYEGYNCTGYRSQDKGFHVAQALVHVFEFDAAVSCPVLQVPQLPLTQDVQIEGSVYRVPCLFADFIGRNLLEEEDNPLKRVLNSAEKVLTDYKIFSYTCKKERVLQPNKLSSKYDKRLVHVYKQGDDKPWILLPSVFPLNPENLLCKQFTFSVACTFLHTRTPVQHQMWLSWPESCTFCPLSFVQSLLPDFYIYIENCKNDTNFMEVLNTYDDYFSFLNDQIKNAFRDTDIEVSTSAILCLSKTKTTQDFKWLATVFKIVSENCIVYHLCLGLNQVAMVRFGIEDWRILWTKNSNYYTDSFFLHDHRIECLYRQKFLFPTIYFHDVSFWLPCDNSFDEQKLILLLRSALMLLLRGVSLLDEHLSPKDGRKSCCYRLCYQSLDGSLSKELCNKIHDIIRNLLADKLKVTLR